MATISREQMVKALTELYLRKGLFWSYNTSTINSIPESLLLETILKFGDLKELSAASFIYPKKTIEDAIDSLCKRESPYESIKGFLKNYLL
jgi:hypothetical protein